MAETPLFQHSFVCGRMANVGRNADRQKIGRLQAIFQARMDQSIRPSACRRYEVSSLGAAFDPTICPKSAHRYQLVEVRLNRPEASTDPFDVFGHRGIVEVAADPFRQNPAREITSLGSDERFHDAILAPGEMHSPSFEDDFSSFRYGDVTKLNGFATSKVEPTMRTQVHDILRHLRIVF